MQKIIYDNSNYSKLSNYIADLNIKRIFLVCGRNVSNVPIVKYIKELEDQKKIEVTLFNDFHPNPTYESIVKGVEILKKSEANDIFAIGGGSAIDVAKCIKLYSSMRPDNGIFENCYLRQKIVENDRRLFAVPTTAGTGSEATQFAVIYYRGEKQSVSHKSIIPDTVLFDPSSLKTLSLYQRKVGMMDALSHSIESCWSINSTNESKEYSRIAINLILKNMESYLNNEVCGNTYMLKAANLAGHAINITQTTAGHAMSYKLTSLYGISHGHAVAICNAVLFPYMINHIDKCRDMRGERYLKDMFAELAEFMECKDMYEACDKYKNFLKVLNLEIPKIKENDLNILTDSINQA